MPAMARNQTSSKKCVSSSGEQRGYNCFVQWQCMQSDIVNEMTRYVILIHYDNVQETFSAARVLLPPAAATIQSTLRDA